MRIFGSFLMMNDENSFPTYSEIAHRLWQGGTPANEMIYNSMEFATAGESHPFTDVVTLDSNSNPVGWAISELRYGFEDGPINRAEIPRILEVADWAFEKWQKGGNVLIRCAAGANRSGLITGIVLMKDGKSASQAIDLIRSKRSFALSNSSFVRFLHEIGGE